MKELDPVVILPVVIRLGRIIDNRETDRIIAEENTKKWDTYTEYATALTLRLVWELSL